LETRRVIAEFDELCRSARELEALLELPIPSPLPIALENGETLASHERMRLELGDRPTGDLRTFLERIGILCFHLTIPLDEFSGLSWMHPEYGPCILVNAADNPGRRSFTTAHEYAHLLRRDGDSICDLQIDRGVEWQASRFAACFLMPAPDVMDTFHRRGLSGSIPTIDQLANLARRYGASLEAMRLRLEELNLVPKGSMGDGPLPPPSRYFGRTRPGWRRRVGERFTSNALMALFDGRISVGKLARYLGMDIRKAIELSEGEREKRELGGIS
jgi:Zn-dependent peptidase ImmA (M78 family)